MLVLHPWDIGLWPQKPLLVDWQHFFIADLYSLSLSRTALTWPYISPSDCLCSRLADRCFLPDKKNSEGSVPSLMLMWPSLILKKENKCPRFLKTKQLAFAPRCQLFPCQAPFLASSPNVFHIFNYCVSLVMWAWSAYKRENRILLQWFYRDDCPLLSVRIPFFDVITNIYWSRNHWSYKRANNASGLVHF